MSAINRATTDGLTLTLLAGDKIKLTGAKKVIERWRPEIKSQKGLFVDLLRVRDWLAQIGESDPETITDILDRCERDSSTRRYFVGKAKPLPKCAGFPDDRRTCASCRNLTGAGLCLGAVKGLIVASRGYTPDQTMLRRCEAYMPTDSDADQRPGAERWPALVQKQEVSHD